MKTSGNLHLRRHLIKRLLQRIVLLVQLLPRVIIAGNTAVVQPGIC